MKVSKIIHFRSRTTAYAFRDHRLWGHGFDDTFFVEINDRYYIRLYLEGYFEHFQTFVETIRFIIGCESTVSCQNNYIK
jgi:hypothetical protein